MSAAIRIRDDYRADELRNLARTCQNGAQARRLMSLAAIAGGKSRLEATRIGLLQKKTNRISNSNIANVWPLIHNSD